MSCVNEFVLQCLINEVLQCFNVETLKLFVVVLFNYSIHCQNQFLNISFATYFIIILSISPNISLFTPTIK